MRTAFAETFAGMQGQGRSVAERVHYDNADNARGFTQLPWANRQPRFPIRRKLSNVTPL